MINNKFKKGIRDLKQISLTSQEKADMFQRITAIQGAVESPFVRFGFIKLSSTFTTVTVAAAFVLFVGGGYLVYAAENSLPGSPLYAIKVNLSEPVQTLLTLSELGKVELAAKHIEKRLHEEEVLATQGNLDSIKKEKIQKSITANLDELDVAVKASSIKRMERANLVKTKIKDRVTDHAKKIDEILNPKPVEKEKIEEVEDDDKKEKTDRVEKSEITPKDLPKSDRKDSSERNREKTQEKNTEKNIEKKTEIEVKTEVKITENVVNNVTENVTEKAIEIPTKEPVVPAVINTVKSLVP